MKRWHVAPEVLAHVEDLPFMYSDDKSICFVSCGCKRILDDNEVVLCTYHTSEEQELR